MDKLRFEDASHTLFQGTADLLSGKAWRITESHGPALSAGTVTWTRGHRPPNRWPREPSPEEPPVRHIPSGSGWQQFGESPRADWQGAAEYRLVRAKA